MLNKIMAGLVALAALFGLYQRNRADRNQAEAKDQSQRADAAEAKSDTLGRVNKAREAVQHKHQQEQLDAQSRMDDGVRDHLDNNG